MFPIRLGGRDVHRRRRVLVGVRQRDLGHLVNLLGVNFGSVAADFGKQLHLSARSIHFAH